MTARVVDTSVVVAYVLKEPGWKSLKQYLRRAYFLDYGVAEALNAVWRAVTLTRRIPPGESAKALSVLEILVDGVLKLEPSRPLLNRSFAIAVEQRLTVYDAMFIALAEQKDATLTTLDESQAQAAEKVGVRVERPSLGQE